MPIHVEEILTEVKSQLKTLYGKKLIEVFLFGS